MKPEIPLIILSFRQSSILQGEKRRRSDEIPPGYRKRSGIRADHRVEYPSLCRLRPESLHCGLYHPAGIKKVDTVETPFGIRTLRFDPDKGFFLNGKNIKLKGVCCHQDHAGVGAALPDRVHEFRIEKLKEMGCNAYRCSHNPPAPELLDACDRLGMLVMDENRIMESSPEILSQLKSLVLRDRNHPSIIMWSLGNEEDRVQGTAKGERFASTMTRLVKSIDPSRPVTMAETLQMKKVYRGLSI